jgi:cell division protein FtsQ
MIINRQARSERHADKIRHRRVEHSKDGKKVKARHRSSVASNTPPPVMVRGIASGAAVGVGRNYKKNRRRIDVPLNVSGAEMRLPSLPQVHIGWRVISFALVIALSYMVYIGWNSQEFRIDVANITGLQNITSRDVNSVLGVMGKSVFMLDSMEMQKKLLESYSEFSSAAVELNLPNTVNITVTERIPVLVWSQDGQSVLVDENGKAFPLRNEAFNQGLYPIIEAQEEPPQMVSLDPKESKQASLEFDINDLQFVESKLPDDEIGRLLSPEMVATVLLLDEHTPDGATLSYDNTHGLSWKDKNGWDVYFGDINDIEIKLRIYEAIFKYLRSEDTKPAMISVEYVHAPYYRLEE